VVRTHAIKLQHARTRMRTHNAYTRHLCACAPYSLRTFTAHERTNQNVRTPGVVANGLGAQKRRAMTARTHKRGWLINAAGHTARGLDPRCPWRLSAAYRGDSKSSGCAGSGNRAGATSAVTAWSLLRLRRAARRAALPISLKYHRC
jgi:hypothetical protein